MDRAARLAPAAALALLLAACASPYAGLRVAQRPADGIVRISNDAPRRATFYYNVAEDFGPYQMLVIRFRDGAGRVINDNAFTKGWWTPLTMIATLHDPSRESPRRERFTIPPGGHVDLARDLDALTMGWYPIEPPAAPCAVQIMLVGYPNSWNWFAPRMEIESEWQPLPCPAVAPTGT